MLLVLGRHGKAAHNVAYEQHHQGACEGIHPLAGYDPVRVPLVEIGIRQAHAAGDYLRRQRVVPGRAFVSPTLRTRHTWAEYRFVGVDPILEPRLREQEGGLFDRLPFTETRAERHRYYLESHRNPDARPPEGESIREHLERVSDWLREVVDLHPRAMVIAVAHYGTVGLLGMLCEGLPLERYLADRPPHLAPHYGNLLGYRRSLRGWEQAFHFENPVRQ